MKIKFILFLLLIFSSNIFGIYVEEDLYLSAMDLYNKKNFEKAKTEFEKFLREFPDSKYKPVVLLKLAELEEDIDKSIELYKKIIDDYKNSENEAEALFFLGKLYYAEDRYKDAEECFGKILSNYSNTLWIEQSYYYLMLSLYAQKKYSDIESLYNDYINNKNFYIFKNRIKLIYADSLYAQKKFLKSAQLYSEIIENYNNDKYIYIPAAYKKVIISYSNTGDKEKVRKYTEKLKEKYPGSDEAKEILEINTNLKKKSKKVEIKHTQFFTIQIGAFTHKNFADILKTKIKEKGFPVIIKKRGKFYKVLVGKFTTKKEAQKVAEDMKGKNIIENYLIKLEKN